MKILTTQITGVSLSQTYSRFILILISLFFQSCSLFTTRPVQDMSQTSAALRAAKEVQADVLAPELFRQASDYFFKAKREYKFKNFNFATVYAQKARRLAEEAEFEAMRNGGNRSGEQITDPLANQPADSMNTPGAVPTPEGTPVEVFEQRKTEEDASRNKALSESTLPEPTPAPTPAPYYPPPTSH
jgi:hypothetical protein